MITRPTLQEIQSTAQADMQSRLPDSSPLLRRGILPAIRTALVGAIHGVYGYLQSLFPQLNPATATGIYLERWASIWKVFRKLASAARGPVQVMGTSGTLIPSQTYLIFLADSSEYITQADVVIGEDGTAAVDVVCSLPGADGNKPAGAILNFVNPLPGIGSTATLAAPGLAGGADDEDDDALRARMFLRIQNAPHGGNKADYEIWAKEVAGISRAWVFPTYSGPGTVRVYVANDAYVGSDLASEGDVAAVQAYIDVLKPVTVVKESLEDPGVYVSGLEVVAPTKSPVDFTLSLNPSSSRPAVQSALDALFKAEAEPEGTVLHSHITAAISNALGVYDYSLPSPATNVTAGAGAICTLGDITWLE